MERIHWVQLALFLCWCSFALCQDDYSDRNAAVYIVTLKQAPSAHFFDEELTRTNHGSKYGITGSGSGSGASTLNKPGYRNISRSDWRSNSSIAHLHDSLLRIVLRGENYLKLYSYHYLINGFAVLVNPQQADKLSRRREVANVVLDFSVSTATTYTPQFLGLPQGAWVQEGGYGTAGEGIVLGFIDTGIDPTHPSFADDDSYPVPAHFSGVCEVTRDFPPGSCNKKLIGARHFAASAITRGIFNSTEDYASPFDGDGHGTHTASVAAGNHGIPVVVAGHNFGNASGIAPRAHIAVYKALYKRFGGFAADVVAAIDRAATDGVDIISLSITPNRRPPGIATFFNPIDMALLLAVKAGIFVVQAAGNTGPAPKSISSFSPWIFSVGAASHDRVYNNSIILGNNVTIPGVGLAPGTAKNATHKLISALDALNNGTKDMYIGECQNPNSLDHDLVRGNILLCSYTVRFVLRLSTIKQITETAQNLSAAGVVIYMDPSLINNMINPTPMKLPGIIIPSSEDSQILLQYYNSSLKKDNITKRIISFGAAASIEGGLEAKYGDLAPKVMYFSARGPDPEDNSFSNADIMKPNLVAPGNSIWAAWSSLSTDSAEFQGESFAMMSGTSMAAPHVSGMAALIKHKFPNFGPSAIGSALSTTASFSDNMGGHIMAQRVYAKPDLNQTPATPFDMGSGFLNATSALDPGLIFYTSFDDYMSFLCSINGSAPVVLNYTALDCGSYNSTISGFDLNLPSIAVSRLNDSITVQRSVTNVAQNETYHVGWIAPSGVSMFVSPKNFSISTGERRVLSVSLRATNSSSPASFGRIGLFGNKGHVVNIPVSVIIKIAK